MTGSSSNESTGELVVEKVIAGTGSAWNRLDEWCANIDGGKLDRLGEDALELDGVLE